MELCVCVREAARDGQGPSWSLGRLQLASVAAEDVMLHIVRLRGRGARNGKADEWMGGEGEGDGKAEIVVSARASDIRELHHPSAVQALLHLTQRGLVTVTPLGIDAPGGVAHAQRITRPLEERAAGSVRILLGIPSRLVPEVPVEQMCLPLLAPLLTEWRKFSHTHHIHTLMSSLAPDAVLHPGPKDVQLLCRAPAMLMEHCTPPSFHASAAIPPLSAHLLLFPLFPHTCCYSPSFHTPVAIPPLSAHLLLFPLFPQHTCCYSPSFHTPVAIPPLSAHLLLFNLFPRTCCYSPSFRAPVAITPLSAHLLLFPLSTPLPLKRDLRFSFGGPFMALLTSHLPPHLHPLSCSHAQPLPRIMLYLCPSSSSLPPSHLFAMCHPEVPLCASLAPAAVFNRSRGRDGRGIRANDEDGRDVRADDEDGRDVRADGQRGRDIRGQPPRTRHPRTAAPDVTNAGSRRGRDERGQQPRTGRTRAAANATRRGSNQLRTARNSSPPLTAPSLRTASSALGPPPSPPPLPPPPPSLVMADEPSSLELASIDKLELLNGTTAVNWVSFEESLFTYLGSVRVGDYCLLDVVLETPHGLPPTPPPIPGSSPPNAPPLPTEPAPQAPILGAWEDDPDRWARTLNKYNKERDDYGIKGRAHAAAVAAHEAATAKLAGFKAISEAYSTNLCKHHSDIAAWRIADRRALTVIFSCVPSSLKRDLRPPSSPALWKSLSSQYDR
ncbi:unnamed protein product [Closterium sp. NIES-65]|nr:unnamed protein product [Closterium sp. NIES-65]